MTKSLAGIRALEGTNVSVALVDGSRIEACELVSSGRGRTATLWLLTEQGDAFVPLADVDHLWAVTPEDRGQAG
jgi:hypothetical protein